MKPIIGIGELLWDIFPDGNRKAGGAPFNFAFHCHQLGHPAVVVSRVGDDVLGEELRAQVRAFGISDEYIQIDKELPTGAVRVMVDANGQPTYSIDMHAAWGNLAPTPALDQLARHTAALCHGTLALDGGPASRSVVAAMSRGVASHGGLTIYDVNLRGRHSDHVDTDAVLRSRWIKVNEDEAIELLKQAGETDKEGPTFLSLRMLVENDDRLLILTRGSAGAEVVARDYHQHEPAPATKVIDTVGAGDAFTAAMVCLYLEGRPMNECLRFANHYAAAVCEHQGATPRIDRSEVERLALGPV